MWSLAPAIAWPAAPVRRPANVVFFPNFSVCAVLPLAARTVSLALSETGVPLGVPRSKRAVLELSALPSPVVVLLVVDDVVLFVAEDVSSVVVPVLPVLL